MWNNEERIKYEEELEQRREQQLQEQQIGRLQIPRIVLDAYSKIGVMEVEIGMEETRRAIKKMKNRKARGNDNMKPEMVKVLEDSETMVRAL